MNNLSLEDITECTELEIDEIELRQLTRQELVELKKEATELRETFIAWTDKIMRTSAEKVINKCPIPLTDLIQTNLRIKLSKREFWPRLSNKFQSGEYVLCPHCDFIYIRDILKKGVIKGNKMLCYNCGNVFVIDWMNGVNYENINNNAGIQ